MAHSENDIRQLLAMGDQYYLEEIIDFIEDNDNVDCDQIKQHVLGQYYKVDNHAIINKIKRRIDFLYHDELKKQYPHVHYKLVCWKFCGYYHNDDSVPRLLDDILSILQNKGKRTTNPAPIRNLREKCSKCGDYKRFKICAKCAEFNIEFSIKRLRGKYSKLKRSNSESDALPNISTENFLSAPFPTKSNSYNIKSEIQAEMRQILGNKTQNDIKRESSDQRCCSESVDDIDKVNQLKNQCEPTKRIKAVLYAYHRLLHEINKSEWDKIDIGAIIQVEIGDTLYGHQQIYDDFYHMVYVHIIPDNNANRSCDHDEYHKTKYQNIAAKICQYLEEECKGKCLYSDNPQQCAAFTRHYRERTNDETEQRVLFEKSLSEQQEEQKNNEIVLQQECDKIHTYFFHSTIKFGTESHQTNAEQEIEIDRISRFSNRKRISNPYPAVSEVHPSQRNNTQKPNIKKTAKSTYIGKKEDDLWWEKVTLQNDSKSQDEIYHNLVENMGVFRWQNPHGFKAEQNRSISHYRSKYRNIKEEALQNTYEPLSKDNWNQTLRKATIFFKSWARKKIRTTYKGYFDDQVTGQKQEWKQGIEITMQEIVILKLYTDFDKLQFALKKCFRFETFDDILDQNDGVIVSQKEDYIARQDLKNRLETFYHWRGGILIVLNKFGAKLNHENNMVLYHGVNAKMILKPSRTLAFNGPLSTTSSYHVARTFATAKGMVLKITSHFPRMNFCNAFDASLISDYPEEQEWLVGFMYVRLLEVRTRKLIDNVESFWELIRKVPISSWLREQFFAIHLFNEQIFSMSEHLERILAQFLKVNRKECCDPNKRKNYKQQYEYFKDWNMNCVCYFICEKISDHKGNGIESKCGTEPRNEKDRKIKAEHQEDLQKGREIFFPILWKKFNEFRATPNLKQRIKFDTISDHLKRFFMDEMEEKEIETDKKKWLISFDEITTVYPNVEEIHFINQYKFDDHVLKRLIKQIKKGKERKDEEQKERVEMEETKNTIKKIVFLYYNYKQTDKNDDKNKPLNSKIFKDPDHLDKGLRAKLENEGWKIKHNKNGKSGYKIRIYDVNM